MAKINSIISFAAVAIVAIATMDNAHAARLRASRMLTEESASGNGEDGEGNDGIFWADPSDDDATLWDGMDDSSATGSVDDVTDMSTEESASGSFAGTTEETSILLIDTPSPSTANPVPLTDTPAPTTTDSVASGQFAEPGAWEQCGGLGFDYSKYATGAMEGDKLICAPGNECKVSNDWYYQCLPVEDPNAVALWGQCGGEYHTGKANCVAGAMCYKESMWYSQCIPEEAVPGTVVPQTITPNTPEPETPVMETETFSTQQADVRAWEQCGGKAFDYASYLATPSFTDKTTKLSCAAGYECEEVNEWYFQCKPVVDPSSVALWGQCGGEGHAGMTDCVAGASCKFFNDWYSQCVPEEDA